MSFIDDLQNGLLNLVGDDKRFKTNADLARYLDVDPSFTHRYTKSPKKGLEAIGSALDKLGAKLVFPDDTISVDTAREVCFVNAKVVPAGENQEPPQAEDYMAVPLVAEVGAGAGYIQHGELLSWFLVYKHQDAVRYRSNLVAVQIGKHSTSMVPILQPGDIVLVDLDDKNTQKPGRIMLVMDPMDGSGMIKRVAVEQRNNDFRIIYYSDNAAENPPQIYSFREDFDKDWNKVVAGHVVWAWSDISGK